MRPVATSWCGGSVVCVSHSLVCRSVQQQQTQKMSWNWCAQAAVTQQTLGGTVRCKQLTGGCHCSTIRIYRNHSKNILLHGPRPAQQTLLAPHHNQISKRWLHTTSTIMQPLLARLLQHTTAAYNKHQPQLIQPTIPTHCSTALPILTVGNACCAYRTTAVKFATHSCSSSQLTSCKPSSRTPNCPHYHHHSTPKPCMYQPNTNTPPLPPSPAETPAARTAPLQ